MSADRENADGFTRAFTLVIDGVAVLLPPAVSTFLIADSVTAWGNSPFLVFVGTLALSAGVFLIALAIMHVRQIPGWLLLILSAVAFVIAGALARAVGQEAPDMVALPPAWSPTAAGAFALEYVIACAQIYGPIGFVLSAASGVYLAWRVSSLATRLGS